MSDRETETDHTELLREILRVVEIETDCRFSWYGERSSLLPGKLRQGLDEITRRDHLAQQLQNQLYRDCYIPGRPQPAGAAGVAPDLSISAPALKASLREANCGRGYTESGWRKLGMENALAILERNGLRVWCPAASLANDAGGTPASLSSVGLRRSCHANAAAPGFYVALSEAEPSGTGVVRFYWHVQVTAAVQLMSRLSRRLNGAGLAFRLKMPDNPSGYQRCDTAVLYLCGDDLEAAWPHLVQVHGESQAGLSSGVPAFAHPLGPGLALAEDPGSGESFGQHRCRLLAGGLLAAHAAGARGLEARFDCLAGYLDDAGLDPHRLHLNPGSELKVPRLAFASRVAGVEPPAAVAASPDRMEPLEIAWQIGRCIVDDAVWWKNRCTWLSWQPDNPARVSPNFAYRSLGSDVYSGTAGVGLFLARLARATDDPAIREAAAGALEQALDNTASHSTGNWPGLYSGATGVALAAASAGKTLDHPGLVERAAALLDAEVVPELANGPGRHSPDLLGGTAGTVVGLLALSKILRATALGDRAEVLGRKLLQTGSRSRHGLSWAIPSLRGKCLTGLTHGASGVGLALALLYTQTGDREYRCAALDAFRFERNWFLPESGNWPDFRSANRQLSRRLLPCEVAWCHGAPGIALARLLAYDMLGEELLLAEAGIALETTHRTLKGTLAGVVGDFCLCHGVAGNAEILALGNQRLPGTGSEVLDQVLDHGARIAADPGASWPAGSTGQLTPGLMLGQSGIGMFFLRRFDPNIPSPLWLGFQPVLQRG